jgi:hypothetical protein
MPCPVENSGYSSRGLWGLNASIKLLCSGTEGTAWGCSGSRQALTDCGRHDASGEVL